MPFEIVRNDITTVHADAIVNTANPEPVVGAGTDSAIHRAAGPRLLAAREKIGRIAVGESRKTPAYDLPARYVLHTVSPAWIDGAHGEEALLRSAYDAALALAGRLHCRSVAFPLLSAGSYGFPPETALRVAIGAFTEYLLTHDMQIILVLFGEDAFRAAKGVFGELRAYVDDRYVGAAEKTEYGAGRNFRRGEAQAFATREEERAEFDALGSDGAARPMEMRPQFAAQMPAQRKTGAFKPAKAEKNELESILKNTECSFSESLLDLLNECGEKDSDVYRRAGISRQLFHKIISKKDYQPTKSTAIQLALGLRLDLNQTQKLLERAGYSLTRSSKTDLVVQYFIERREYSIVAINLALYDCNLPLLKTGGAV
ncbi:MAG: macro domain-containing protein [Clostridia bacterium]|nr:macro domain-containing protein [Clostridia bacterium]